jgi:hypothetical protein
MKSTKQDMLSEPQHPSFIRHMVLMDPDDQCKVTATKTARHGVEQIYLQTIASVVH